MAYDADAESLRLITEGLPAGPVRLSRRHRFAPVSVDVVDEVAATWFVRRGVGCFWDEVHLLARTGEGWRRLGSGGSSSGGPWSTDEFEAARHRLPATRLEVGGGASVARDASRRWPFGGRWIRTAQVLAGPAVAEVVVDGARHRPVPYHGRLLVVWSARRPPRLSARDTTGREIATVVAAWCPQRRKESPCSGGS